MMNGNMDVHRVLIFGSTMLHRAVLSKNNERVSALLKAGASVNIKDEDGNTPLSCALQVPALDVLELLLKYDPDFNVPAVRFHFYRRLIDATSADEKVVRLMIKYGFKVKETDSIEYSDLWFFISLGFEDCAISCVAMNSSLMIYIENWFKAFRLHMQPYSAKQTEVVRILGKIMSLYSDETEATFMNYRNLALFKMLLSEYFIDLGSINVMYRSGRWADRDEIEETNYVTVSKNIILACYDSVSSVCDEQGRTGFHYAAKVGNIFVIKALVDLNWDINTPDNEGRTPLNYIFDRINEFNGAQNNNLRFNNSKRYDSEFACYFTVKHLKIGALLLMKQMSKLIAADSFVAPGNLLLVQPLTAMFRSNPIIPAYIQRCEEEVRLLKSKRLINGLSYHDFVAKSCDQIAVYTRRDDVIAAFQLNNNIVKEFDIFGGLIQERFNQSYLRRGLLDKAEIALYYILKPCCQLPSTAIREILSNMSTDELYYMIIKE